MNFGVIGENMKKSDKKINNNLIQQSNRKIQEQKKKMEGLIKQTKLAEKNR